MADCYIVHCIIIFIYFGLLPFKKLPKIDLSVQVNGSLLVDLMFQGLLLNFMKMVCHMVTCLVLSILNAMGGV